MTYKKRPKSWLAREPALPSMSPRKGHRQLRSNGSGSAATDSYHAMAAEPPAAASGSQQQPGAGWGPSPAMGPAAAPAPAPSADAVCPGCPRAFEEAQLRLQLLMQQAPSSVPSQTAEVQVTDARWGPGGRVLPERTEASSTPPLELTGGRALRQQSGHDYMSLAKLSAENRQLR